MANWFHSDRFSVPAYLLSSAVGFVAGTTGLTIIDEFSIGSELTLRESIQSVFAAAMLLVGLFDIIGPRYAGASLLMVPATIGLIFLAMRLKLVNFWFAALSGIPVSFIFMVVTLLWSFDRNTSGRLYLDSVSWTAIIVGGLVGGLTYFASGKLLGLWKKQTEMHP